MYGSKDVGFNVSHEELVANDWCENIIISGCVDTPDGQVAISLTDKKLIYSLDEYSEFIVLKKVRSVSFNVTDSDAGLIVYVDADKRFTPCTCIENEDQVVFLKELYIKIAAALVAE